MPPPRAPRTPAASSAAAIEARPALAVTAAAEADRDRAASVAADLGLPLVERPGDGALALVLDARGWSLVDAAPGAPGAVRADLLHGALGDRLREGARGETRLAKAMGLRSHPQPRVLDATAGLGRESVLAAALGCDVIACERSPVVALLLRDALERAAAGGLGDLVARIDLRVADAREVLAGLPEADRPDVVLVDPMFPDRRKAARAKKEMQLLQRLLVDDDLDARAVEADTEDLLRAAIECARRRVVVKRPAHAPPVGGRRPDAQVPGRAARYDIYLARVV